jgi:teichoic acid transport system permease protein
MSTTEPARATADIVRVHTPYRKGLPNLRTYFKDLWDRRHFAYEMSRTQIRSQHLNTALGQLWLILNPLLLTFVYFMLVLLIGRGGGRPNYLPHIMAGLFLYYFFNACVNGGAGSVVGGGRLILNTAFPKALLPLSAVLVGAFRFFPTLAVFVFVRLVRGDGLSWTMLWGAPVFVLMAIFGAGMAMMFATFNLYFRDVSSALPYVMRLWLYMSPVLFFPEQLLDKVPESVHHVIIVANPLFAPLATWSRVMVQDEWPQPFYLLIAACWAIAALVVGGYIFLSREREFAVRL